MDKYIGKKVDGRYEVRELIGVGGMANVYKAYDVIEERIVAVKLLREELASNEEFLRRFKNESRAISVLSHPNIVKVYDVSFSDRMNSIVMEYIDGITLKEYIEHQKVLRYREAVHFTVQILRALQHAHEKGIVHRDIKPQNIMLLRDATIKITDFGIARFSRSETRTLTDKAIGSVHYISPEQASGSETDARTDIYSVGVMLYEMLTGRVPFEADSPVSVAIKQIQSPLVRPREINPEIPEALEEIILRATQKDVNQRYQSAAEMLRDIGEFKKNPTISFEYKYLSEPVAPAKAVQQEQEIMQRNFSSRQTQRTPARQARPSQSYQPKSIPVLPVLAGISFAFALVAVLFIIMLFIINDPLAEVPDVIAPNLVGQQYSEAARNREYRENVVIEVEETQFNSEYEEGVIFKQEPAPGKTIKQGATIRVKVSAGIQTVILPNYSNQEATEVYKKLREQGLDYDEFMIFSDTISEGYVVRTDPEQKSEVQSGDLVTVYVSRGPQDRETRVPDVTGMNFDQAKTLLATYKLRVSYVEEVKAPDDEEPGTVLEQSPEPDTQVREGSAVELTIVRGYLNQEEDEEDEGSGEKTRVRVEFSLPQDINETVKIAAYDGNKKIVEDELNPAEAGRWIVNFKGSGRKEITLRINGAVYAIYEVDFNKGTYQQV